MSLWSLHNAVRTGGGTGGLSKEEFLIYMKTRVIYSPITLVLTPPPYP